MSGESERETRDGGGPLFPKPRRSRGLGKSGPTTERVERSRATLTTTSNRSDQPRPRSGRGWSVRLLGGVSGASERENRSGSPFWTRFSRVFAFLVRFERSFPGLTTSYLGHSDLRLWKHVNLYPAGNTRDLRVNWSRDLKTGETF